MTRVPVARPISWPAVLPQFAALASAIAVGWYITRSATGIMWGAGVYLLYSFGSRALIARNHRRGMRLFHRQQYDQAIHAYEESYSFFTRYSWLDRFRAITMMSSSAISYRESALCNIAFCYSQIGDGEGAKEYYRRTLDEFPNSGLASAALKMIESVERPTTERENAT